MRSQLLTQHLSKVIVRGVMRGREGGSSAQFSAIKDGKTRITIFTFRVSQFTENKIIKEEQRRRHIDSFYCRSPRKATNHCLCFFWKLFIYVRMMGSFLVFFHA